MNDEENLTQREKAAAVVMRYIERILDGAHDNDEEIIAQRALLPAVLHEIYLLTE